MVEEEGTIITDITIYLDHDGTLTYYTNEYYDSDYKNGVKEFIEFLIKNFDVKWCSGASEREIKEGLINLGASEEILFEIEYFDNYNLNEKSASLIELGEEFILIDDDPSGNEIVIMKENKLEDNFIKSNDMDADDLYRIMEILNNNC